MEVAWAIRGLPDKRVDLPRQRRDGAGSVSFRQRRRPFPRCVPDTVQPHRPRRHDPAAGAAHVDAGRKAARAVADRLAAVLAEDVMITLRGVRSWMAGKAANVGAQLCERLDAVGSLVMTIGVYHHKRSATELDTGDGMGKLAPPNADLHFVRARLSLPVLDA